MIEKCSKEWTTAVQASPLLVSFSLMELKGSVGWLNGFPTLQ